MKIGDGWKIKVSHLRFKNRFSTFWLDGGKWADFEMTLPDEDGLYHVLEEYLNVSRGLLLRDRSSDLVFIKADLPKRTEVSERRTRPRDPLRSLFDDDDDDDDTACAPEGLDPYGMWSIVREWSGIYLAWNPYKNTGVRTYYEDRQEWGECSPFGPHAFRHIWASVPVRESGMPSHAAVALCDTEDMIIARYMSYPPAMRLQALQGHVSTLRQFQDVASDLRRAA